jgi:hypothetical protein
MTKTYPVTPYPGKIVTFAHLASVKPPRPRQTWAGSPPAKCDLCQSRIIVSFIDGKTLSGPWASMCERCHGTYGIGLGTGKGQHYELHRDGKTWYKVSS